MFREFLKSSLLRMMLVVAGLAFLLSGCHLHHGYFHRGHGYHDGGHYGWYQRDHRYKRHGHFRHHHHRGWRGRY